jgi:hypothetical protein
MSGSELCGLKIEISIDCQVGKCIYVGIGCDDD